MFPWDGPLPAPHIRTLADMAEVLAEPMGAGGDPGRPLYFMYRDLARNDHDRAWLEGHVLRYDATVIPPGRVGGEYVKTKGHFHPENRVGVRFPEVYEVVTGKAHFLLQTWMADDVVLVEGSAGDVVVIPPGYGHVTINPGEEELVLANIVSTAFSSEYGPYVKRHGAAYYEMADGTLAPNPAYEDPAPIRLAAPAAVPAFCTGRKSPLYSLVGKEKCLDYLNRPEKYGKAFSGCLRDLAEQPACAPMP
ncbi:glucose-6-phosphate isomerase [Methanofollis aquaemaris]|uniref:glucose-6-phosphate isomerase n=2 Tax=Methanofollis aquaemaris TaxID=126734 RepID=A0A8A3S6U8_9EURY|nr:glucose-6-phosphate isomerase [Methanofollis aquaemaris]